jgi:hypothetical protein
VAAVGLTIAVVTGGASTTPGQTIHVIEHANTDATADVDPAAIRPATCSLSTIRSSTRATRSRSVATRATAFGSRLLGRTSANWTTVLENGHITVDGPFFDTKDSVLAITGGTGAYRDAHGVMELKSRAGGTKFAFIFHFAG